MDKPGEEAAALYAKIEAESAESLRKAPLTAALSLMRVEGTLEEISEATSGSAEELRVKVEKVEQYVAEISSTLHLLLLIAVGGVGLAIYALFFRH